MEKDLVAFSAVRMTKGVCLLLICLDLLATFNTIKYSIHQERSSGLTMRTLVPFLPDRPIPESGAGGLLLGPLAIVLCSLPGVYFAPNAIPLLCETIERHCMGICTKVLPIC